MESFQTGKGSQHTPSKYILYADKPIDLMNISSLDFYKGIVNISAGISEVGISHILILPFLM